MQFDFSELFGSRLGGQREVLLLQHFGSFLDPIVAQWSFFLWTLLVAAVDTQSPRTLRICHSAGLVHVRLVLGSVDLALILLLARARCRRTSSLHGKFSNFLIKEVLLIWQLAEVEVAEVELAEVEHPQQNLFSQEIQKLAMQTLEVREILKSSREGMSSVFFFTGFFTRVFHRFFFWFSESYFCRFCHCFS